MALAEEGQRLVMFTPGFLRPSPRCRKCREADLLQLRPILSDDDELDRAFRFILKSTP